jgi:hypothetical protein
MRCFRANRRRISSLKSTYREHGLSIQRPAWVPAECVRARLFVLPIRATYSAQRVLKGVSPCLHSSGNHSHQTYNPSMWMSMPRRSCTMISPNNQTLSILPKNSSETSIVVFSMPRRFIHTFSRLKAFLGIEFCDPPLSIMHISSLNHHILLIGLRWTPLRL